MGSSETPSVLDVGQCDFDHGNISAMLADSFAAKVDRAHSATDALQAVRGRSYHLVLVNRILDRDGSEGIDIVRQIQADESLRETPVMIVSNFADAQEAAVAAGARRGFGKNAMHDPQTRELLVDVLGQPASKA